MVLTTVQSVTGPGYVPPPMTSKMTRRATWLMAPLLTFALLAGCGGSDKKSSGASGDQTTTASSAPSGSGTAAGSGGKVQSGNVAATIKSFKFSPTPLTVKVGTKVTWTNNDSSTHTVTADGGSFDLGKLGQGKTASFTFSKAGTFAYHCDIHPTMKATVTVQ